MRFLLIVFAASLSASAQLKIIPVGSHCGNAPALIQHQILTQFDHPVNWTVVLACDDSTWDYIQRRAISTIGRTDYAFTDLDHNYSYFRVQTLVHPDFGSRVRPEFIMAHEAAHILARCSADKTGEKLADAIAERLIHHQAFADLLSAKP